MQFKKSVGMRTIKTGMAVVLTLYVAKTALISNPFYAAIGTVFAMQNTVKSSFVAGKNRVLGTVIGAIVGFIFAS
ncbi:MAG: aromatic acid exporter family protein, partial [Turicibacter sp.]